MELKEGSYDEAILERPQGRTCDAAKAGRGSGFESGAFVTHFDQQQGRKGESGQ